MVWQPFLRLLAAAVFAGAIGLDRELRAKPAGLRTNIVVGVAAAAFAYVSATAFDRGDPGRIAAQIVSGIGFLGGGAIFAAGGKPHGLTTAAALWGSAAAGLAAGLGAFSTGFALVAVTVIALWPLDWFSGSILGSRRRFDLQVTVVLRDLEGADEIRWLLQDSRVRVEYRDVSPFMDHVALRLLMHGRRLDLTDVLEKVHSSDKVLFISEQTVPRGEPVA